MQKTANAEYVIKGTERQAEKLSVLPVYIAGGDDLSLIG